MPYRNEPPYHYKTNLSWNELKLLGVLLARLRDDLIKTSCDIQSKGKTKMRTPINRFIRECKQIDQARCIIDDYVFTTFPEKTTKELCNVMYPTSEEREEKGAK